MQISLFRWSRNVIFIISVLFLLYILLHNNIWIPSLLESNTLQTFKTMFISIILEAIPVCFAWRCSIFNPASLCF